MKEKRTAKLEIRLTPTEKETIKQYAEDRNTTVSEVVRQLCLQIFKEER